MNKKIILSFFFCTPFLLNGSHDSYSYQRIADRLSETTKCNQLLAQRVQQLDTMTLIHMEQIDFLKKAAQNSHERQTRLEQTVALLKQQLKVEISRRSTFTTGLQELKQEYSQLQRDLFFIFDILPVSTNYPKPGESMPLKSNALNTLKEEVERLKKDVLNFRNKTILPQTLVRSRSPQTPRALPVSRSSSRNKSPFK